MAKGKKPSIDGALVDRFHELVEQLGAQLPNTEANKALVIKLSNMSGDLRNEAANIAIEDQGNVIMAAIRGELTAWPGCTPEFRKLNGGSA